MKFYPMAYWNLYSSFASTATAFAQAHYLCKWVIIRTCKYNTTQESSGSGRQQRSFPLPFGSLILWVLLLPDLPLAFPLSLWASHPSHIQPASFPSLHNKRCFCSPTLVLSLLPQFSFHLSAASYSTLSRHLLVHPGQVLLHLGISVSYLYSPVPVLAPGWWFAWWSLLPNLTHSCVCRKCPVPALHFWHVLRVDVAF